LATLLLVATIIIDKIVGVYLAALQWFNGELKGLELSWNGKTRFCPHLLLLRIAAADRKTLILE